MPHAPDAEVEAHPILRRMEVERALIASGELNLTPQLIARWRRQFEALVNQAHTARISVEERRREHATMLAYGVKIRGVIGVVMREAVVIGLLATAIGTVAGIAVLQWILDSLATRTLPDFEIVRTVSTTTLVAAVVVGVLSVTLAPLFLVRRIRRMDLPDTLRVME